MKLLKYKENTDSHYIYFWIFDDNESIASPFYDSEEQAIAWLNNLKLDINKENA
jgi:hypothetical protein